MKFQPVYGIDSFKESKILIIKMESDKNGDFIFQPVYGIDSFKESKILIIKMESDKNGDFIYDIDTYSQICKNIIKALPSWITAICLPPGISVEWLER